MFDDFRQQAADESAFEETNNQRTDSEPTRKLSIKLPRQASSLAAGGGPDIFLGMTAAQRLVISIMLLMMTCTMGLLILLVTEKMALGF
jgi:hypothetical protein